MVPTSRPDASIKQRSRPFFIGDDLYGGAASRQTWIATVRRGTSFLIRAENDGSDPDRFVFDGCGPTSAFAVRYFFGGSPVTRRVVAGTFERGPVAPGAEVQLRLEIHLRASEPDGGRLACSVSVTSTHDATKSDVVRGVVFAGPTGCFPEGIRSTRNEIRCPD